MYRATPVKPTVWTARKITGRWVELKELAHIMKMYPSVLWRRYFSILGTPSTGKETVLMNKKHWPPVVLELGRNPEKPGWNSLYVSERWAEAAIEEWLAGQEGYEQPRGKEEDATTMATNGTSTSAPHIRSAKPNGRVGKYPRASYPAQP